MRVISLNGLGSFLAIALTFSHFGAETRADDYEVNVSSLSSKESGGDSSTVTNKLWYANAFTIQAGEKNTAYFNSIFLALAPRDMSDAAGLVVEVYSNSAFAVYAAALTSNLSICGSFIRLDFRS